MAEVTSLGLGKTMGKKLRAVGIHSAEELKEIGSLYHLEAAIRGCEIKQLGDSVKAELKDYFKQL